MEKCINQVLFEPSDLMCPFNDHKPEFLSLLAGDCFHQNLTSFGKSNTEIRPDGFS